MEDEELQFTTIPVDQPGDQDWRTVDTSFVHSLELRHPAFMRVESDTHNQALVEIDGDRVNINGNVEMHGDVNITGNVVFDGSVRYNAADSVVNSFDGLIIKVCIGDNNFEVKEDGYYYNGKKCKSVYECASFLMKLREQHIDEKKKIESLDELL